MILSEASLRKILRRIILKEVTDFTVDFSSFGSSPYDEPVSQGNDGVDWDNRPGEPGETATYHKRYGRALKELEALNVSTTDIIQGREFIFPVQGSCFNAGYDVATMGRRGKPGIAKSRKGRKEKRTELVHIKYGIQNNDWSRKHKGIDIFCQNGKSPLQACVTGVITKIGKNSGKGGNTVTVTRGDPKNAENFYYAHLHSHAQGIQVGQKVTAGTVIGYCGKTGSARGTFPHLHFSYYVGGNYFNSNTDPWRYLEPELRRLGAKRVGQSRRIKNYSKIEPGEVDASLAACPTGRSVT